eukprot:g6204.t1
MLKSQAPSRQKVKGGLPPSKRLKTTQRGSTAARARTAGAEGGGGGGGGGALGATPAATVSRSTAVPTSIKASIGNRAGSPSRPPRPPRGWQTDPHFQIKNVIVASVADRNTSATAKVPAASRVMAAMNRSSATTSATSSGLARRVKKRPQQQPGAAEETAEIDWRVASTSTKTRRNPAAINSPRSRASSRGRIEARGEAVTAERSPAKRTNSSRSSSGEAQSSSIGSKSSNAGSRTASTSSPRKKHASATAAAAAAAAAAAPTMTTKKTKKERDKENEEGKEEEEEEKVGGEEKLPPCPYPGHQNVSWTCRGCGGAKHHLTSRSAMEPLQRVHGFKVQRVPNDGDCFFSSIKAALPDGAAAGTEAARTGRALTVAEMREWVAEETGEEQLEFYTLQAGAHPEDRWLDFVRPLDERIPSDDDEDDEDDEDKDDDSYKDDAESAASLSQSQSQGSRSKSRTSPRKSSAGSRLSRAGKTRGRKKENGVQIADDDGSEGGNGKGRRGKRGGGGGRRGGGGDEDAGEASTCTGDEGGVDDSGNGNDEGDVAVTGVSTSPASERHARRLRRRRDGDKGPSAAIESPAVATDTPKKAKNAKPSLSQPATGAVGSPSRKSARLGRGRHKEEEWRVGADSSGGKGGETAGTENREKGNKGTEDQDQNEGLPFVQTVEDLRRFVRLEGSVVGHGNCMWADTFAHHVVARRLKITILFVDMEREKKAWPYRVLARTMTDSDDEEDERFVVLKREPSHFVLLKTAPPPDEKGAAAAGNGGDAATATRQREGQACFSLSDLPDVVRRLWQIEPKAKSTASGAAGGCG